MVNNKIEDTVPWFQIWVISSVVLYLLDFYLDARQLRTSYITEAPSSVREYVDKEDFKKCRQYTRAKGKLGLVRGAVDIVLELAVWTLGYPAKVWAYTAPWSTRQAMGADGKPSPVLFDFCQALLVLAFFEVLGVFLGWPFSLVEKFMIEEAHGFNK